MSRINRISRMTAGFLALLALTADFLSPSHPDDQNLELFLSPPSRIRFFDAEGGFHLRPFIYPLELSDPIQASYSEQTDRRLPLQFFCSGYRYRLLGVVPASVHLVGVPTGKDLHPWGTDDLGRDVMARALAGTRSSLLILLLGLAFYLPIGVLAGSLAGMCGGWIDSVLMRFSEFVLALPALYLVLAIRALMPARMPFWSTASLTAVTIAAVTWPPLARGVRGLILQALSSTYMEASRAMGASPWRSFRRHILPAVLPHVMTQALVAAPVFILGEVVLSFLNFGLQDTAISWGTMLRLLHQDPRILGDFWWNLVPLVFVFVSLFCVSTLARRGPAREPFQLA
jgi:peptide/nickel transport system permease protein